MLSSLVLGNLVNFEGPHYIHFGNEPRSEETNVTERETERHLGIFIGENGAGKSALLEIIRRCLSSSKNVSTTNRRDESKASYVICKFIEARYCDKGEDQHTVHVVLLITSKEHEKQRQQEEHGEHGEHQEDGRREKHGTRVFKAVILDYDEENEENEIAAEVRSFPENSHKCCETSPRVLKEVLTNLSPESASSGKITTVLEKFFKSPTDGKNECDTLCKRLLDHSTVFTFGHLSISPLQWSEDPAITETDNYAVATQRATILRKLWKEDCDRMIEGYKFTRTEDGFVVTRTDIETPVEFHLLKCPTGVFNAMCFLLITTSDKYRTVSLEEPDTSMHPQLMSELQKTVKKESKRKTIILTTHNSKWIEADTLQSIVVVKKLQSGYTFPTSSVTQLRSINVDLKLYRKLSWPAFRELFTTERVLFVEGDDDLVIVNTLLATQTVTLTGVVPSVLPLNGKDNSKGLRILSDGLGVKFQFLLDRDYFIPKEECKKIRKLRNVGRKLLKEYKEYKKHQNEPSGFRSGFKSEFDTVVKDAEEVIKPQWLKELKEQEDGERLVDHVKKLRSNIIPCEQQVNDFERYKKENWNDKVLFCWKFDLESMICVTNEDHDKSSFKHMEYSEVEKLVKELVTSNEEFKAFVQFLKSFK